MVRYVEVWNLAAGGKQEKKRKLSGADSAWLLVSNWSQQAGKSLSDKVESILSDPKEPALWRGQQAAKSA